MSVKLPFRIFKFLSSHLGGVKTFARRDFSMDAHAQLISQAAKRIHFQLKQWILVRQCAFCSIGCGRDQAEGVEGVGLSYFRHRGSGFRTESRASHTCHESLVGWRHPAQTVAALQALGHGFQDKQNS